VTIRFIAFHSHRSEIMAMLPHVQQINIIYDFDVVLDEGSQKKYLSYRPASMVDGRTELLLGLGRAKRSASFNAPVGGRVADDLWCALFTTDQESDPEQGRAYLLFPGEGDADYYTVRLAGTGTDYYADFIGYLKQIDCRLYPTSYSSGAEIEFGGLISLWVLAIKFLTIRRLTRRRRGVRFLIVLNMLAGSMLLMILAGWRYSIPLATGGDYVVGGMTIMYSVFLLWMILMIFFDLPILILTATRDLRHWLPNRKK